MRGSDPIFTFKTGDHTCVFYSDLEGLLEVLTPYVLEGLKNNQRCLCAQRADTLEALAADLQFLGVDVKKETRRGALELYDADRIYVPDGRFEPSTMITLLERSVRDSVGAGFSGFRAAGDLAWAVEGHNECDRLIEYEEMVDRWFPGKPIVGLCQYAIREFTPRTLDAAMNAHSKILDMSVSTNASLQIRDSRCDAEIIRDTGTWPPVYRYVVELESGDVFRGKSADCADTLKLVEDLIAAQSQ